MTKISYHCMHNLIELYILNVINAPVTSTMIFNISFLTHYEIRLPLFQERKQKSTRITHWYHFQVLAHKDISFSYTAVLLKGQHGANKVFVSYRSNQKCNPLLLCNVLGI